MESKIKSFRDLDVWKLGKEVVLDIYTATKRFPKEELYGLIIQIRRAAVSIPSNIAEGFNRYHNKGCSLGFTVAVVKRAPNLYSTTV